MKKLFPLVMTDIALFTVQQRALQVLLVQRKEEPAAGEWGLPGGFLLPASDLSLDHTAIRVLRQKTSVDVPYLAQVGTFSGVDRDPRGWSVCTLYYALLPADQVHAVRGEKTQAVEWCAASGPGRSLAFDHARLLESAVGVLRDKVSRAALPLHLMAEKFTLTELQQACEAIIGTALDKSVFRRRIKEDANLVLLPDEFLLGPQRPAQLYRAHPDFTF